MFSTQDHAAAARRRREPHPRCSRSAGQSLEDHSGASPPSLRWPDGRGSTLLVDGGDLTLLLHPGADAEADPDPPRAHPGAHPEAARL
ncbi:MAG: adenosylhomocysteinase [Planctomycetota bacterium]